MDRMLELSEYFSGEKALTRVKKDVNLQVRHVVELVLLSDLCVYFEIFKIFQSVQSEAKRFHDFVRQCESRSAKSISSLAVGHTRIDTSASGFQHVRWLY